MNSRKTFIKHGYTLMDGALIIQALEKMGGKNIAEYKGNEKDYIFYVNDDNYIIGRPWVTFVTLKHGDWEEIIPNKNDIKRDDYVYLDGDTNHTYIVKDISGSVSEPKFLLTYMKDKLIPEKRITKASSPIIKTFNDILSNNIFTEADYYSHEYDKVFRDYIDLNDECQKYFVGMAYNEKQAMHVATASMASLLIPYYGGHISIGKEAYTFIYTETKEDKIRIIPSINTGGILRFKTQEYAEEFYRHNKELVRQYLMIDDYLLEIVKN